MRTLSVLDFFRAFIEASALIFILTISVRAEETQPAFDYKTKDEIQKSACSFDSYASAIVNNEVYEEVMRIKRDTGFLPPEEEVEALRIQLSRSFSARRLAQALGQAKFNTTAIVYGSDDEGHSCAWYMDKTGIIASAEIKDIGVAELKDLWSAMDVEARSARRAIRRRKKDGSCELGEVVFQNDPNTIAKSKNALLRLSSILLPETISSKIVSASAGKRHRLLIVPTGEIGKVPFAALPVTEDQSIVDLASIVLLKGLGDLGPDVQETDDVTQEPFSNQDKQSGEADPPKKIHYVIKPPSPGSLDTSKPIGERDNYRYKNNKKAVDTWQHISHGGNKKFDNLGETASIKLKLKRKATPTPITKTYSQSQKAVLIVGDPDLSGYKDICWPPLRFARDEVKTVSERLTIAIPELDSPPLTGTNASFESVFDRLEAGQNTLQFVYFATHGVADPRNPADGSYLALSGKYLKGAHLRKLSFTRKPIVIMSACQTGLGKSFQGGVFGLADAWYYAGASTIFVSLWSVSDEGTNKLMSNFIENFGSGIGVDEALQVAMKKTRLSEPDPAVWAAFTIYGKFEIPVDLPQRRKP